MDLKTSKKLFLVGIPPSAKKKELIRFFQSVVPGQKTFFLKIKIKGLGNNGCATLFLKKKSDYDRILKIRELRFKNRCIFVKKYMKGGELQRVRQKLKKRKIFVKGLPRSITNEEFFNFFTKFGELEDAFVVGGKSSIRRGQKSLSLKYGFLVFKNAEQAQKFLKEQTNLFFDRYRLLISSYRTKEEKKEEEESARQARIQSEIEMNSYNNNQQLGFNGPRQPSTQEVQRSQVAYYTTRNNVKVDISTITRYDEPTEVLSHYDLHEIFLLQNGMRTYSDAVWKQQVLENSFSELHNQPQEQRNSRGLLFSQLGNLRSRGGQSELIEIQEVPDEEENEENFEGEFSDEQQAFKKDGENKRQFIPYIEFGVKDGDIIRKLKRKSFLLNHSSVNLKRNWMEY